MEGDVRDEDVNRKSGHERAEVQPVDGDDPRPHPELAALAPHAKAEGARDESGDERGGREQAARVDEGLDVASNLVSLRRARVEAGVKQRQEREHTAVPQAPSELLRACGVSLAMKPAPRVDDGHVHAGDCVDACVAEGALANVTRHVGDAPRVRHSAEDEERGVQVEVESENVRPVAIGGRGSEQREISAAGTGVELAR